MFLLIAFLYSSVGQAGASGYIAAMALFGLPPITMKITALALNLLVAGVGSYQFHRNGKLRWRHIYPFAVLGFPFSLIGGAVQLAEEIYYPVVGGVLLLSAFQMIRTVFFSKGITEETPAHPPFLAALLTGAAIGFLSGMTGTGGGIFLAPVILTMNWATARQTASITAVFNFVNSGAALAGSYAYWHEFPASLSWWLVVVGIGGFAGAFLGSKYLSERWLRLVLALLLVVSGLKLIL